MKKLHDWLHYHKHTVVRVYGVGHCAYFTQIGVHYMHEAVVLGVTCFGLVGLGVVVIVFFEGEGQ